jgi:predicted nucleotidyltransferase
MDQPNPTSLDDSIKERIEGFSQVRFAMIFGSRATDRPREDSDIDLGIYLDDSLSKRQRFDIRVQLGNALLDLGQPDIVVLNDAPPLLGHQALLGRVLLIRDRVSYVRYCVKTLAAAGDERPWRRLHREQRARRLQEGTFGRP